jgi:hypothetical protein
MGDETKIVMVIKGLTATIGISKPDCDPIFFKTDGPLPVMLGGIPRFLEDAEAKWKGAAQYPKTEVPAAPQPAAVTPAPHQVKTVAAAPKTQQSMF